MQNIRDSQSSQVFCFAFGMQREVRSGDVVQKCVCAHVGVCTLRSKKELMSWIHWSFAQKDSNCELMAGHSCNFHVLPFVFLYVILILVHDWFLPLVFSTVVDARYFFAFPCTC